jgi:hypothetical protein
MQWGESSPPNVSHEDRYFRRRAAFTIRMQRLLLATLAALSLMAASCAFGTPSQSLIQVVDQFGPSTVGPSLLAGASIAELSALIKGAGGDCPDACWSQAFDPAVAYFALLASDTCVDRDLITSIGGSTLSIMIAWRPISCIGSAARSTLIYSLFSVPRKSLPTGPVRITARYSGQTVYHHAASGDAILDLIPPGDAAGEHAAVDRGRGQCLPRRRSDPSQGHPDCALPPTLLGRVRLLRGAPHSGRRRPDLRRRVCSWPEAITKSRLPVALIDVPSLDKQPSAATIWAPMAVSNARDVTICARMAKTLE